MSLSPSAKLLLSKHPKMIREILLEFKYSLGTCDIVMEDVDYFLKEENNLSKNCPHCGIPTDGSSNEQCYKAPEKDWEIVSISEPAPCKMYVHPKNEDGTFGVWSNAHHTLEEALKIGWGIHSVKRPSDNEIFTIGDEVEYVGGKYGKWIIQNFFLKDEGVLARSEGNNYCEFVHDKNFIKSKPVLSAIEPTGCNICGSKLVEIRGQYPRSSRRKICPTCAYERLEQINEIIRGANVPCKSNETK